MFPPENLEPLPGPDDLPQADSTQPTVVPQFRKSFEASWQERIEAAFELTGFTYHPDAAVFVYCVLDEEYLRVTHQTFVEMMDELHRDYYEMLCFCIRRDPDLPTNDGKGQLVIDYFVTGATVYHHELMSKAIASEIDRIL